MDALVPNMMLQPIIENAIKHGIADRTDLGHIEVSSAVDCGRLRITIRDDGPGLEPASDPAPREGIGLSNTRARLRHLYGEDHSFTLENGPGRGLQVTVDIPFQRGGSNQEEPDVDHKNTDRG
jgi:sensor histidine kinase YesM